MKCSVTYFHLRCICLYVCMENLEGLTEDKEENFISELFKYFI